MPCMVDVRTYLRLQLCTLAYARKNSLRVRQIGNKLPQFRRRTFDPRVSRLTVTPNTDRASPAGMMWRTAPSWRATRAREMPSVIQAGA